MINDLDKYYENQYPNIWFCLKLFDKDGFMHLDDDNDTFDSQFSEIILCFATICIEKEKHNDALDIIKFGIKIGEDYSKDEILGKLYLMRASIYIVQHKD